MPSELPTPFNEDGTIKPEAQNAIIIALILRLGGKVELAWDELQKVNGMYFYHPATDHGMLLTLEEPERLVGHC